MIASQALITPHSETTKRVGIPQWWIVRPGYIYIYYVNPRKEWAVRHPRKEWGGKARIRLTKMSPYDMNLLKNVAH